MLRTPLHGSFGSVACDAAPTRRVPRLIPPSHFQGLARINMNQEDRGAGVPRAFNQAPAPSPALHPMALEVMKNTAKPSFTGNMHDLPKFKREWNTYLNVMRNCNPSPITEFVILHSFKDCLKGGVATHVSQMINENPLITMAQVWHHLESRYGVDTQAQEKARWKAIRLVKSGSKIRELQLSDWEKFEAEFNAQKVRVPDRSAEDEHDLIYFQLPRFFQKKVTEEQHRLNATNFWVRATYPNGENPEDVLWELENALQTGFLEARVEGGAILINTGSSAVQGALINMDGSAMGGGVINLSRFTRKLTGEEIFSLVRSLPRIDEEVAANRRTMGGTFLPEVAAAQTTVHAVASTPLSSGSDAEMPAQRRRDPRDEGLPAEKYGQGRGKVRPKTHRGQGKGKGNTPQSTGPPKSPTSSPRGKGKGDRAWSEPMSRGSAVAGRGKGGFNAWNYNQSAPPSNPAANPPAFVPPAPRTYVPGECFACKCAGREFRHNYRNCQFDAEMRKPATPQNSSASSSAPKPKAKPTPPHQA